jgi:hypothetical protein
MTTCEWLYIAFVALLGFELGGQIAKILWYR